MSARKLRVALIAGGRSSEHDISLASARSVLQALDPGRYDVVSVAIGRDGRWELESAAATQELGAGPAETLPVPTAAFSSPVTSTLRQTRVQTAVTASITQNSFVASDWRNVSRTIHHTVWIAVGSDVMPRPPVIYPLPWGREWRTK